MRLIGSGHAENRSGSCSCETPLSLSLVMAVQDVADAADSFTKLGEIASGRLDRGVPRVWP